MSDFKPGQRVWAVDALGRVFKKVVVREQLSEGPGPRWDAVRLEAEGYEDGFNWPKEDVFRTRKAAELRVGKERTE